MPAIIITVVVILLLGIILLVRSITIVRQSEKGIVERWGRYMETLDPGLRFLVPFADKLRARVDMRETVSPTIMSGLRWMQLCIIM